MDCLLVDRFELVIVDLGTTINILKRVFRQQFASICKICFFIQSIICSFDSFNHLFHCDTSFVVGVKHIMNQEAHHVRVF